MHRIIRAAAFTIAAVICTPALADETPRQPGGDPAAMTAREQGIETMLSASGLKDKILKRLQMDQQSLAATARREIGGVKVSDAQAPGFSTARDQYLAAIGDLQKQLDWQAVRGPVLAHHGKLFSDQELDGITKFFSTDAGVAFRERQTAMMAGTDVVIENREKEMLPTFQGMTQNFQTAAQALAGDQAAVAEHPAEPSRR